MNKVKRHPTAFTLAIIFSALALGFIFGLVASRTGTPQVSADSVPNTDLLVTSNTLGPKEINVTPTIASNPVGESHTITATVTTTGAQPATGIEVNFIVIAGPNTDVSGSDITDAGGTATFTYSSERVGTDTIAACFADDSGDRACDLAAKHWTKRPPAPVLRLTPSRDINPVGTQHTVTATVTARDKGAQPVPDVLVDFRVIRGPTAGVTGSDTTDANGLADFSYQGIDTGVDIIVACVDAKTSRRACDWAVKRWTSSDDVPGDGTSCQGANSCHGRNISVGENSCNGEESCRGNNLTIGDNSCDKGASCRGNELSIGNSSCNGDEACRDNGSQIGSESCNDEQACKGNNSSVGDNSCNGKESCAGNNGNVGDNACNSDEACPADRNRSDYDNQKGRDRNSDDGSDESRGRNLDNTTRRNKGVDDD